MDGSLFRARPAPCGHRYPGGSGEDGDVRDKKQQMRQFGIPAIRVLDEVPWAATFAVRRRVRQLGYSVVLIGAIGYVAVAV
jgi:hypothetical protein